MNRNREPDLLDKLGVGNRPAEPAQHVLGDGGLVGVEDLAQAGDDGLVVHDWSVKQRLGCVRTRKCVCTRTAIGHGG